MRCLVKSMQQASNERMISAKRCSTDVQCASDGSTSLTTVQHTVVYRGCKKIGPPGSTCLRAASLPALSDECGEIRGRRSSARPLLVKPEGPRQEGKAGRCAAQSVIASSPTTHVILALTTTLHYYNDAHCQRTHDGRTGPGYVRAWLRLRCFDDDAADRILRESGDGIAISQHSPTGICIHG